MERGTYQERTWADCKMSAVSGGLSRGWGWGWRHLSSQSLPLGRRSPSMKRVGWDSYRANISNCHSLSWLCARPSVLCVSKALRPAGGQP